MGAVGWVLVCVHFARAQQITDTADAAVLRALAEVRTGWLTAAARAVDRVATGWAMFVVAMLLLRRGDRLEAVAAALRLPRQRRSRCG